MRHTLRYRVRRLVKGKWELLGGFVTLPLAEYYFKALKANSLTNYPKAIWDGNKILTPKAER